MSGLGLTLASGRYAEAGQATGFIPPQLAGSPVTDWLRLQASTQSGGEFTNWASVMTSNPATQSDTDRRATVAAAANGLPIATFDATGDMYSWPLASSNNGTVTTGLYVPIRPTSVTGTNYTILSISLGASGASARKLVFECVNATLRARMQVDASNCRGGTTGNVLTAGAWTMVGFEFNGGGATEAAKCVITVNGVAQALTFSDTQGTPGAMPSTLVSVTGNAIIGSFSDLDTGVNQFDGSMGPNFIMLGAAMPTVTSGLLTTQARLALAGFEMPT